ncbi:fatty acyl-CoA reductase wat-like [Macrosteles quadrilineatus]|uniref:fatty acyl-CoA reductase wat-like n=1 Tax=Macrosteles quadrilineatus TaxID=74068 RepID=UPI0023E27BB5|nr:fatty acyl-CoA reductase wat-like [Macrosteles quadrilineatus]
MEIIPKDTIPESFRDATVLISGATGFMGKVLTEKLLRSCPDIHQVYLLVREKKGKNMHQRMDEIFQDPLFSVLEQEQPKYRFKVTGIGCDISAPGLALSDHDRQILTQEVSVVFHGAATVRFDEKLRAAYNINVRGTQEMLNLAKEMKNLKAFIHVSTAYANCHLSVIDETLYPAPFSHQRLKEIIEHVNDDDLLEAMLPKLLGEMPNTYAFTKAVAEHVVKDYTKILPVTIFRPAIVVGTAYEPLIGWTDNLYGPTGLVVGAGCGVLHSIYANVDCIANIVPVDMTVNALIASARETMAQSQNNQTPETRNDKTNEDVKIYNYVSSVEKPLKWGEFKYLIELHGTKVPPMRAMWYYFMTTHRFLLMHMICTYFLHYLPALIIDGLAKITGKESPNLYKVYKKIDKFTMVLAYFAHRSWDFSNNNVQAMWKSLSPSDQKTFNFDMKQLDWDKFFYNYIRGLRVYLLKDDMSTLPQAMVRWRRFYWAHQTLKALFGFIVLRVAWTVGSLAYNSLR